MQPTLVILAAGMGSRYGGLKQIDPIGPNGEIIMDYSIHDALAAGFGRVVFVIRRDIEVEFKRQIGNRYAAKIACDYVFQELDALPAGHALPAERRKPWGTGHAVLMCAAAVREPFCVINADDYYGASAYQQMAKFFAGATAATNQYAMVGFDLAKTLSSHGTVARGICQVDNQFLQSVTEHVKIGRGADGRIYGHNGSAQVVLPEDAICSMNFWGFWPHLFTHLHQQFCTFLDMHGQEPTSEFFLPSVIDQLIRSGQATATVLASHDRWFGVTYPEDKITVAAALAALPAAACPN